MRTIKFREVLWALGYKLGDDPSEGNFLTGRALALTAYINAWVRKLWDSADWPEWTVIGQFTPSASHIVLYERDQESLDAEPNNIGRALKVYLNDPATTPGPLETPFRLLTNGVHCGFEHGTNVWIKYIPFPPAYSSEVWRADITYNKGNLVYSPISGECYKSMINGNIGIDPSTLTGYIPPPPPGPPPPRPPPPLTTEVTQEFLQEVPSFGGSPEQWLVEVDTPAWFDLAGTIYHLTFIDTNGVKHEAEYVTPGAGGTLLDVINGLDAAVSGGDAFLASLTINDGSTDIEFVLSTAAFSVKGTVSKAPPTTTSPAALPLEHTSNYMPVLPPASATPQKTNVFMDKRLENLVTGYTLTVIDAGGVPHTVEYESPADEALADTMAGIAAAVREAADTDAFWGGVVLNIDAANNKFELATAQVVSVDATGVADPLAWILIPFPLALADAVIRGAYSDALREEGQTDKAGAEEGAVASETGIATSKSVNPPYNTLTDQARPKSRYKVEVV